jgi:glycosyltransferase involved in cell wall biosynthesis
MVIGTKRDTQSVPMSSQPYPKDGEGDRPVSSSIMLFDLSIHGHHPAYIQHIIHYWHLNQVSKPLNIVVSPQFLEHHADVVDLAAGTENVSFVAIAAESQAQLKPRNSSWNRMVRSFQEWQLLCQYAETLATSHCLVMYFDTCQIPLVLGQKSPCLISGIYFKPSFHYPEFVSVRWSWQERWQQWREKLLIKQVLRQRQLHTLFNLDPLVGTFINRFYPYTNYAYAKMTNLPDPVQTTPVSGASIRQLRQRFSIEEGRQVFLLFGALNGRKGIYQLLEAIVHLPDSLSEKMCLLLVGQSNLQDQVQMLCQIEMLREQSPVQIIAHHEFVPESEVPLYFELADVVLAPYPKHIGMSGVLIWAAAAQKPVLSSNYGLMGELVRRYHLGLTVDATRPDQIAQGLILFLQATAAIGDRHQMQIFAAQNSAEAFAHTILQRLLPVEFPL